MVVIVMTHEHPVELETSLDFLNTLEHGAHGDTDELATPELAFAWLEANGLLHGPPPSMRDPRAAGASLAHIRDVRSALREVYDAVVDERPPSSTAIATANDVLASRDSIRLEPDPHGIRIGHDHAPEPVDEALGRLAHALVDAFASDDRARLRTCDNETCRWAFHDTSPAGRRRWCSMASCGNRAKAARHRARTKGPSAT
jgi:predicted RNA-binding Zn ribbon-like protein